MAHGEKGHSYELDEEKVASEARWDGLFGILTDLPLTTEEEIREALLDIRSTLIRNTSTKKLYSFPRKLSSHAKKLLKSLGIPYSTTPREILSPSRYRHRFREGMPKE